MTKFQDIITALRNVGLSTGDIVLVHSALGKIGEIDGILKTDRTAYLESIYNAFAQVINIPEGTLVVPTFSHDYARNSVPFVYETTPSEVGAFSEYIREKSESLRSIHPINSFTAIGSKKHEICSNLSRSCYGYNSVFDRLIRLDATMLFLGADLKHMTLKHHMEHMAGLPYTYHKAYFTPVYKDGIALPLPFLACVRYLNGQVENNDCAEFKAHLESRQLLRTARIGEADILAVSIKSAFDEAYKLLQSDPCYFLTKPYYETV